MHALRGVSTHYSLLTNYLLLTTCYSLIVVYQGLNSVEWNKYGRGLVRVTGIVDRRARGGECGVESGISSGTSAGSERKKVP